MSENKKMSSGVKWMIAILIIVLLSAIGYSIYDKKKNPPPKVGDLKWDDKGVQYQWDGTKYNLYKVSFATQMKIEESHPQAVTSVGIAFNPNFTPTFEGFVTK